MHPVVVCQHRSRGIDDGTGPHPDAGTQESLGISGRDEADVVAVGFFCHRQPSPGGNLPCGVIDPYRTARRWSPRRNHRAVTVYPATIDPAKCPRDAFLLAVMGSPDARQIDGMGGADPLTSKVAVVIRM